MNDGTVYLPDRNAVTVAVMAGDSGEFSRISGGVLRAVRGVAVRHSATGQYLSNLGMKTVPGLYGTGQGVKDRLIVADDPGAAAIEWGHLVPLPEGVEGPRNFVPGKHIMARGLRSVR